MKRTEVLIIGAGPTGLALALWLTKNGVQVRIIDKADRPGTTSRALVMHARNMEFYHQLGIAQETLNRSIEFKAANLWVRGKKAAQVQFSDIGTDLSPYPYMLIFPQDRHEQMLIEELEKVGVQVERDMELISFTNIDTGVRAQLRNANGETEECEAAYMAGCDGAHSTVRHQMHVDFPGGTYENTFYVADLTVSGDMADGDMHAAVDSEDFLALFPMQGKGRVRLVGAIRQDQADKERSELKWEDVSTDIIKRLNMQVEAVHWFSTYRVHHRVASHFREGNVFLAGDAGHVHSPVGGQGMNTGIGDAVNLAWKLKAVLKDGAPASLLDTYETERIAFARRLVATTDKAFEFVSARGFEARLIRTRIAPIVLPLAFHFRLMRRYLFKVISQIQINYESSALSQGSAGPVKGGDRLPWVQDEGTADNFAPLRFMDWQIHCYGMMPEAVQDLCAGRDIPCYTFPWTETAERSGLQQNAVYVVRPDGYIGMADAKGDATHLKAYMDEWNIGNNENDHAITH